MTLRTESALIDVDALAMPSTHALTLRTESALIDVDALAMPSMHVLTMGMTFRSVSAQYLIISLICSIRRRSTLSICCKYQHTVLSTESTW